MTDARIFAPAAARNAAAVVEAMRDLAPATGEALEIASGSGEHAVAIAAALPGLTWRPTDIQPDRLASIDAWAAHEGLATIAPAAALNAVTERWTGAPVDLTFAANILHLIDEASARAVVETMAAALKPGGRFMTYGPFLRADGFASDGDRAFDARLKIENPGGGYKLVETVEDWMRAAGLGDLARREMPANNLILHGIKA
ncbi:MAG: DUF938 domain-containing protein [Pseudomonadota bacterium]